MISKGPDAVKETPELNGSLVDAKPLVRLDRTRNEIFRVSFFLLN